MEALRPLMSKVPGVEIRFTSGGGFFRFMGSGSQVSVELYGYDLGTSRRLAAEIQTKMKKVEGLKDVEISRKEGKPEMQIIVDKDKASRAGLLSFGVASNIQTGIDGAVISSFRDRGKEYDIRLQYHDASRKTLGNIENMKVPSQSGRNVVLKDIAEIRENAGPSEISRKNQDRVVYINANVSGKDLGSITNDLTAMIKTINMPGDFSTTFGGNIKEQKESFRDMFLALILAVALVYMVMASQFESFFDPFIIMFTMPLAAIGVLWALFLTGTTINVISLIGVLILAGVVVNNAIVLIDYTNTLRARGLEIYDAIVTAGETRLRPILMTTITTILGLIPMALDKSEGSEMMAPLAITLIGGLTVGTMLTLLFIPVLYSAFERTVEKWRMKRAVKEKKVLKSGR